MCVPVLESAREIIGVWVVEGLGGKRSVVMSLRRNVRFEYEGMRPDCRVCEVGVYKAKVRRVVGERARSASCSSFCGGPGVESRDCARREPWSWEGVGLGIGIVC